ncbi:MAG: GlcG/HbpS family heme-binding protein [Gammaproteobacteria bacterium]
MTGISLAQATVIVDGALEKGAELGTSPLTVAVLDPGGQPVALKREDGSGNLRAEIATAKAWGALGMGISTRFFSQFAERNPALLTSFSTLARGRIIPAAGGVLIRNDAGELLGAVGVSGDSPEVDEQCAIHGISSAKLHADLQPPPLRSAR